MTCTPLVLAGCLALAPSLAFQAPNPVRLHGRVVDLQGVGLREVEVVWVDDHISVFTSADGSFTLVVPKREHGTIVARRPGYRPVALLLDLQSGGWEGTLVLRPGPQVLPSLETSARAAKPARYAATTKYDGFFLRQRLGLGAYVTRDQIERSNATHTLELLARIPGIHVDIGIPTDPSTADIRMPTCTGEGHRLGKVTVWIDGQRQMEPMISGGNYGVESARLAELLLSIPPGNIEMIEVYRSVAQLPGEFHWDGCAAIVIWTRYNAPPDSSAAHP